MITATQRIRASGHPEITAMHPSTFEVTTDEELSKAGDCIIAVGADTGAAGLDRDFKTVLCHDDAILTTTLICNNTHMTITSKGSSSQLLDNPHDLVWRRSGYVCGRTIGIHSSHTARTIPRDIIGYLQKGAPIEIILCASV